MIPVLYAVVTAWLLLAFISGMACGLHLDRPILRRKP